MNDIEFRIAATIGKGKNLVYYREIDTRPRAIYVHAVRGFRKTLISLLRDLPDEREYYKYRSMFLKLIRAIDPKLSEIECIGTILRIKTILENE